MNVHLIDGTYELFRHFFAVPSAIDEGGQEVGAVRGVVTSVLGMINRGVTHIGVATDHVIESFRNRMWRGYKTSAGVPQELLSQFTLLEEALQLMGVVVWPMVEYEADDALAAAATKASADPRVDKVFICTPDKDLAQCVSGSRIVQLIRRTNVELAEEDVVRKFGVRPASIPDYLALVGDTSDGYPGLAGWGPKSAAAVLSKFEHLERIPEDPRDWKVNANNASTLAATFARERTNAFLFRDLATLRTEIDVFETVDALEWKGPTPAFTALAERMQRARTGSRKVEGRRSKDE